MLGFVSCDEDFNKDVTPPQANNPEEAANISFTASLIDTEVIDLNKVSEDSLAFANATIDNPEGTEGFLIAEISKTEDFKELIEIPTSIRQTQTKSTVLNVFTNVSDLNTAVKELFGKAPNANKVFIRFYANIKKGTSSIKSEPLNLGPIAITPIASLIEPSYYLIGDMNSWNPDEVIKFSHSGNNVYEDPNFAVILEVAANTYFKIAPQSAVDAHAAGGDFWETVIGTAVDGDPSLEGSIVTENAQAIKIEDAGYVRISLNMEEYTYKIEPMEVNPLLYVTGNHQSWDPATAPTLYTANMDMIYDGFVYLDGEYKFTSAPNWDNTNYGNGGDGKLSTDGGAGNLNAEAGFYYLKANLNTLTYEQTKTEWGLIGDATPGGWDNSTPMTYNKESNTWTVETTLEEGKDFKFRANNSWDINLGGSLTKLTFGGDNIRIETSGTYVISLKLINELNGYSCTLSKK